jgi:hypothetical protein
VLCALLAATTRAGEVAAVVDLPDALDPASLARAGARLERILWVRPPAPRAALQCAELILAAGGFALVALDFDGPAARLSRAAWPRLVQAARRAGAACVVSSAQRRAGAAAALVLQLDARRVHWSAHLLDGLTATATLTRSRFGAAGQVTTITVGDDWDTFEEKLSAFSRRRSAGDGQRA